MKVTRVGENEIRCILSEEEMVAFGIDLDDILEKNMKSGKFFNEILSRAASALGEADAGELKGLSAQISVLNDRSISILLRTRRDPGAGEFAGILRDSLQKRKKDNRSFLVFFKSIDDAVSFCRAGRGAGHLVSRFLHNRKNDEYVLLVFRYACDEKWFDKVRLLADEFGSVNDGETASKVHVLENSDMLISDDAFYTLGKM